MRTVSRARSSTRAEARNLLPPSLLLPLPVSLLYTPSPDALHEAPPPLSLLLHPRRSEKPITLPSSD